MIIAVSLKFGGRRLKERMRKASTNTQLANVYALNRAGRWARTRIRRDLSDLLSVSQKMLRMKEIRAHRKNPRYELRFYRREYPIALLKGTKFRPRKGQSRAAASTVAVGRLRFRVYGHQIEFEQVRRTRKGGRVQYMLIADAWRRARRVMGTWVKADYREPRAVKKQIGPQWRREFRRQMARLQAKR